MIQWRNIVKKEKRMDETKELENWLTVREASDESGYAEEYLRKLVRDGELSAIKKGSAWLISRESLMEYKDKKTQFN
jgi:excisionase family DNA binding protein